MSLFPISEFISMIYNITSIFQENEQYVFSNDCKQGRLHRRCNKVIQEPRKKDKIIKK